MYLIYLLKGILYILRWLFLPVSWLYGGIMHLRNVFYDQRWFSSQSFAIPTIVVGNLTVGGTGKTPHTEYLIRLLKDRYRIVTLSRGYGRKTKGFLWATAQSTAQDIGDEPLQFYQKFNLDIQVAVGEDRVAAIERILAEKPTTSLILLDDAFQHRRVKPSMAILLTDYKRLFYKDCMLPTGYLREPGSGARRAQCMIVSKCPPNLSESERQQIVQQIRTYTRPEVPVFFTSIRYGQPQLFSGKEDGSRERKGMLLVSGIAQPSTLEAYATQQYLIEKHLIFQDHYDYTQASVEKIADICRKLGVNQVLTTEKDFVKLSQFALPSELTFFYLPIEMYFLFDEEWQFATLVAV